MPTLLADPPQNMIAQSQSGTGKTAAFVLAMLSRVDTSKDYPQVMCLSPTYELAIQTGEVAAKMAQFCPIKIRFAVRGEEGDFDCFISDLFDFKTHYNSSWTRRESQRAYHHWHARKNFGLVHKVQSFRYQANNGICA